MTQTTAEAPPGALTHRQILVVLSGLLLGMFLAALDQTIVATAMRTIADELQGQTVQAWATTAYLITSTIATPLYGKLSDLYGRRPFYLFAIAVFVVGSALCGTAGSIPELAAYRAVQGIGAGGLLSLAFAIVGDLVAPRDRGRYQGYFMAVFGSSSVLGPVIGGFLAGQSSILGIAGWRWIFFVNVPIGLLALAVVTRVLNVPHTPRAHRVDYGGAALLTLAVVPVLVVAEQGNAWGWGSPASLALIVGGLVALVAFVAWEHRMGEDAILPLRFFRNSVFRTTGGISFLLGAAMFGGLAALPLYLQIVRGETPTRAGLLMIPLVGGIIVASGIAGQIMSRTGRYKVFPIIGTALMVLAMLLLSTLVIDTPLPLACSFMFVMGAGLGLSMQTLVIAVQNSSPPQDMGVVTSSATFFRSMGGTFGTAVFLSILFNSVPRHIGERFAVARSSDPGGIAAAQAALTPDQSEKLASAAAGGSGALDNTEFIAGLPGVIRDVFLNGFADSMSTVFLVAAALLVPAFALAWRVREVPLRSQSGVAEAAAVQRQADQARSETAVV